MQPRAASTTQSATSVDSVTKLVPGASHGLAHLSDSELLTNTRHLVGKSNQVFAALLVHLAEVESRGIYRTRACSSLYTYCIYELRFSEDAASRRASAAKLVRRFPMLFDAIASGELHLTGLLMLGPLLTSENHLGVLARAKFRTKKEIAKLVRTLAPLPQVPDRIEPLGPEPSCGPRKPTWAEFVESLCPPVRELAPGQRPRDWANDTLEPGDRETGSVELSPVAEGAPPAPALVGTSAQEDIAPPPASPARVDALVPAGDGPCDLPPLTGPQLYQMQFTTTEEHVQLVERAKALLSRQPASTSLGELHLQAMTMLVAALEKQKFGVGAWPRKRQSARKPASAEASQPDESSAAESTKREHPRQRRNGKRVGERTEQPRQRGRYIPAAKRRAVFERDGARCTYVDERGQRCRETHGLEIHHLKPFAKRGRHQLENLALRCGPHNALAAEDDFGRENIARKRDSSRHESQRRAAETDGTAGPPTSQDT